ncbi:tripartite tricarboxylate transporter TctB family protein [Conyzicola nivalis]|uniref:tripartite tricarboxylate transporter TctB family protein n=1 Tax=Conyzicola nivalis TaxID=1477021 RepID=UPI00166AA388|nr:tripartite tricarboxylate transporter TctB family protein [Conyzicola nivalis]
MTSPADRVSNDAAEPIDDAEDFLPAGSAANVGAAVAPLLLGVVGVIGSVQLGLGAVTAPGPGLWPFAICLVIVLCSAALLIGGRRFWDAEAFSRNSLVVAIGLLTLVALVIALPYVGFEIPCAVLCFVWLRFLGGEKWWVSIVISLSITLAFWLIFVLALRIPLPRLF